MTRKTRNHRPPFDAAADFVALTNIKINGAAVRAGEGIDTSVVTPRRLEQMFESRQIGYDKNHVPVKPLPQMSSAVGPTDIGMDVDRALAEQEGMTPPPPPRKGLPRPKSRRRAA